MSPLTEEAIIRALDAFTALIGQQQPEKPKCSVDVHLDREALRELQKLIDAVAEDQDSSQRRIDALEAVIGGVGPFDDVYTVRGYLQNVVSQINALQRKIADAYVGVDHRALIRDAAAHIEEQVVALGAQVQELQSQMAQTEQRQRGWRSQIDHLLGRRPRG